MACLKHVEGIDTRDRAEISLLKSVAFSRVDDFESSQEAMRDAHVFGISAADPVLLAEIDFYVSLFALGEGRINDALQAIERGLNVSAENWPPGRTAGWLPREHVISRIQELCGIVRAAQGLYSKQLDLVRSALTTLDGCAIKDVYQESFALRNLAIFTRDFDVPEEARLLFFRVPELSYTADISHVEFATLEALGWCAALRGDIIGALRQFRKAENAATTAPERVTVGVNRALFAREASHHAMVVDEVEYALDLADSYNWENAAGDTRDALLSLAQVGATIVPKRARAVLDRYSKISRSVEVCYAARLEPRARAEEDFTHGLVLRAEGRLGASMERLQSAFETWDRTGYAWRAGRAALELAELDAGDVFRLAVRRELRQRPESLFANRARRVA